MIVLLIMQWFYDVFVTAQYEKQSFDYSMRVKALDLLAFHR